MLIFHKKKLLTVLYLAETRFFNEMKRTVNLNTYLRPLLPLKNSLKWPTVSVLDLKNSTPIVITNTYSVLIKSLCTKTFSVGQDRWQFCHDGGISQCSIYNLCPNKKIK